MRISISNFSDITLNEGKIYASTIGCGCCGSYDEIDKKELEEEVENLKEVIKQIEELIANV